MSLINMVDQFALLGYEVTLIAPRSKNVTRKNDSKVRTFLIPARNLPIIPKFVYASVLFLGLPFFLAFSKPDYVITEPDTSIFGFASSFPLLKLTKTRVVLDIRSTPVETVGLRGFLQTFFFAVSVLVAKKFFSGMTIITPMMKSEVCSRFNIDSEKVGVWPSGVSSTLFDPAKFDGLSLKAKLGFTDKFIVFYHGVFSENRGLKETVKAMSLVKSVNPNVILFLLGTGPLLESLKELVDSEKLQDTVIIHHSVDYKNVPEYIAMCNVAIVPLPNHPYWRYQSPLKLVEYLAMEKTTILTDIPAHRLVIGEKECGIYVLSIKPIDIANAIQYAYNNKDKLEVWGKIGREIVEKEYTWGKIARDLDNYLSSIQS